MTRTWTRNSPLSWLVGLSNALTYGFARIGEAIVRNRNPVVWIVLIIGAFLFPYFGGALVFSVFCYLFWNYRAKHSRKVR